jgi:putative PIN family toxin of toxin-antitoxin system
MPVVVLLDANVWVSAFINPAGAPARLLAAWLDQRFEIVISLPLLEELSGVLTRPRITQKYPITTRQVEEFLQLLSRLAQLVVTTGSVHECRDPDDDVVLETALVGHARYVVTRDPDLVTQLDARGVLVMSVRQFLESIEAGET